MDDCDLEKLSALPAKLAPKFNRNTTEYEATVPSNVETVKVDYLTSDSGASCQVFGGDGEKTIPLKEGEINEIRIEVSAEDGTVKNYYIRVKRLSASDASLVSLSLSTGKLDPPFTMDCDHYTAVVPCHTEKVTVQPKAPDSKCVVLVCESEPDFVKPLLMGETKVVIKVRSVDGENTKEYTIDVCRKQLPFPITLKDPSSAMKYECPMTLSPMYAPISVAGSDPKVSMSQPCIDMLTRRSKVNPLNDVMLDKDWRLVDTDLDKKISNCVALSAYSYKGVKDEMAYNSMANHINSSSAKPKSEVDPNFVTETPWYKADFASSTAKTIDIKHNVEVRNWEKRLQHMTGESDAVALNKAVKNLVKAYKAKLPKVPGQSVRFSPGESPVDDLQNICVYLAAAAKAKSKDGKQHLKFAFALEEQHHLAELYGFTNKEGETADVGAGTDIAAKESSKLEECQAICKLRGVAPNAPIALQLKAIDEEYQSLRDSGQSGRADHVQGLYVWRSKQALKGEQSGLKRLDNNEHLAQAYFKYMDALVLDSNHYLCNFHAGRFMIERDEFPEAVQRLQQAVGLKPVSVESRFFLGMALCLQASGAGARLKEALTYLHEGLEHLLMTRQNEAEKEAVPESTSTDFHAEDIFRLSNVQVLQGLMILAKALQQNPQDKMRTAKDVYHCVCLHASMALCVMYHRGNTFQQIEWILLDAHYQLLELMMKERSNDTEWISQRCRYLSSMIRSSTIPRNKKLLALQEKVSQNLVSINPCDSESLYLLGLSQFMIYDSELSPTDQTMLLEARGSLEASIALEGKPASGECPEQIAGQKWWKEKVAAEKRKEEASKPPPAQSVASKAPPTAARGTPAAARGRGAPPPRGKAKTTPAPAQSTKTTRGIAKPTPAQPRGRGVPAGRGTPVAKAGSKTNVSVSSSNPHCDKSQQQPVTVETPKAETKTSSTPSKPAPLNRVSYQTRLALARAYSRTDDKKNEARERYEEVIEMAPEVHDSYIELAEMLVRVDPLAAVDVYCRFPSSDSGAEDSFDDAYLSGEIVSILMKKEKFDDPRLVEHMVKWGRVMGIAVLDKYMGILDSKFKTDMLKNIYAGVHKKDVKDPDLVAFFKFKCWI